MNELVVINQNGQLLVDSRQVADMVEVRHGDLLEKIGIYEKYLTSGKFRSLDFFIPEKYIDTKGEARPCYHITRKGCDMVANKLTGEKGVLFTATYVTKFEEMERTIKQIKLPKTYAEALRDLADSWEQNQKLLADNTRMKPKEESYDMLMDAEGCLTMDEVAKTLDIKNIGRNNLFRLLVLEKIIYRKGDIYLPMQEYKSHFIVKQNPLKIGSFVKERSQLFMNTRGLDWLAHTLVKRGYSVNYNNKTVIA